VDRIIAAATTIPDTTTVGPIIVRTIIIVHTIIIVTTITITIVDIIGDTIGRIAIDGL
jgi:hypothetical protein